MAESVFSSLSLLPPFLFPMALITTGLIFINFVAQRFNRKDLRVVANCCTFMILKNVVFGAGFNRLLTSGLKNIPCNPRCCC